MSRAATPLAAPEGPAAPAGDPGLLRALGIRRIACPVPFPQAGGPVNLYALEEEGGGWALFDCGLGTEEGERAVRHALAEEGIRLEEVRRLFLSHGHIDHYGLARTFSEASGAPVFVHPGDRVKIERPAELVARTREASHGYLSRLGVEPEPLELLFSIHELQLAMARPVEYTQPLLPGPLTFARCRAEVVHSPGHTPGQSCLFVREHGVLLSGDHLLERVSPNPLIEVGPEGDGAKFRALPNYLRTIQETRALPVDLVLPGHGTPFTEPRRTIDQLCAFYDRRQGRLLGALRDGPRTAMELVRELFPRSHRSEVFLTLSEIVGNLEILEDRGLVARLPAEPLYRWELVQAG